MTTSGSNPLDPSPTPRRLTGLSVKPRVDYEEDGNVDILRLFRSIWYQKLLIALICIVTSFIFFTIAMLQTRQYTAVATVMLDPREQQVVATQDQVVSDLKLNSPILESEVAILRSTSLLIDAINKIGIARFNIIAPDIAKMSVVERTIGTIKSKFLARDNASSQNSGETKPILMPDERRLNRIIAELRQGMSIRRLGDSYVIETSISTIDPQLSALLANTLANGYIERQLQDRRRVAESATQWLAEQVEQRRMEVVAAETAVEAFKRKQLDQSFSTDDVLAQQLVELNQQLIQARAESTTQQARLMQIETLLIEQGAVAVAETQQSAFIISMRTTRAELVQADSRLAETVGPQHPERRTIANEIGQLEKVIGQEVKNIAEAYRNEISVLLIRETSLRGAVETIQADLSDNAAASLNLRQLEREAEAARDTYEELLARLGETRAQTEIQRAEARLVNAALPPGAASSPKVGLLTAFGATLGLTGGLVAALILEMVSAGFMNSAQIERMTGIPVLSTIPRENLGSPASVIHRLNDHAYSLFAERIRQLRTVLEVGTPERASRSIVVLSSLPNEGKTTTALALARSYAMAGKSTLLLDLDTRRSALAKELTVPNPRDLGDYLTGTAPLEDIVFSDDRLGFSIAGSQRYKALLADNVSNAVLNRMLTKMRERFDIIIIDSPPVLAVSDGLEIAAIADSILYVVQYRKTSRKSVSYGLSSLNNVGIQPNGIVLNMTDVASDPDSYAGDYTYD